MLYPRGTKKRRGPARRHRPASSGSEGFSLVEVIVILGVLGLLAAMVIPRLMEATDRAKQRRTIADMRSVANANASRYVDQESYAPALSDLVAEGYLVEFSDSDAWGTPWDYQVKKDGGYKLESLGSDKAKGPEPPDPWLEGPYEPDLKLENKVFKQAPTSHKKKDKKK